MHPLADLDPQTEGLKAAYEAADRSAKESWRKFEEAKREAERKGVDLVNDRKAFEEVQALHGDYKQAADAAAQARQTYLQHLENGAGIKIASGELGRDGTASLGKAWLKNLGVGGVGLKALDGTAGGSAVPAFFDERIRQLPQRALFVRSLIPVQQAEGDKVHYLRHSVFTNLAAPTAPGAEKPRSVITVERIEETVRTIAHVSEALDRSLLSDLDQLVNFLDATLRLGVLLAEENQIVNGNGTPPNLRGVLATVGIQTQARGTDSRSDAIYKAMTKVRLNAFLEPDGIVLHPTDFETIRLEKTADGEYLSGPVVEADPPSLFGKPVVTSPVIAQGTGIVGAFGVGATIWDREQARVTFTESGLGDAAGQELFSRNQLRFRGEERITFGVERPAAFCSVTAL